MTVSDLITSFLPDAVAVLAWLIFIIVGGRKGMFRTFSGLFSLVVSLFGAMLVANYGAVLIADHFVPILLPGVEAHLADVLAQSGGGSVDLGVFALIPGVKELVEHASQSVLTSVAPAVAKEVATALAWLILFVLAFIVCRLVCKLISLLLDLIDHLPGLHFVNHFVGALLGAAQGFLVLLLLGSLLLWLGVLPKELVEKTVMLHWLLAMGPVY